MRHVVQAFFQKQGAEKASRKILQVRLLPDRTETFARLIAGNITEWIKEEIGLRHMITDSGLIPKLMMCKYREVDKYVQIDRW